MCSRTCLRRAPPINRIKGVTEINLEDDLGDVPSMPVSPVANSVNSSLAAERDADTDLQGPQEGPGFLFVGLAHAFADKPPQRFSDSDGPNIVGSFGDGKQRSTCKVRRELGGGGARGKDADDIRQVGSNLVAVGRAQGLAQVVPTQATRAGSAPTPEAASSSDDFISCDVRHLALRRRAKRDKAWQGRLAGGMLSAHFGQNALISRAEQRRVEEGVAGTGELSLRSESFAAGLASRHIIVLPRLGGRAAWASQSSSRSPSSQRRHRRVVC